LSLELRKKAALDWVCRSIAATGGNGSAHSYALHRGWAKAYPETTGYLIETLLDHADTDHRLHALAIQCADWLESQQMPSGAFPGLLAGSAQPSVFNTGQILFGLLRCGKVVAATRAAAWLLAAQEQDGAWLKAAYRPGFEPSYYTRVVWPLLCYDAQFPDRLPNLREKMHLALRRYATRFLENHAVQDWGFERGKPAFTHTIAYTLEGFWMSAQLLQDAEIAQKTIESTRKIIQIRQKAGKTAGRFDFSWKGDYGFSCPTGNAQLSLLCHSIWEETQDALFALAAIDFLEEVLPAQYLGAFKPIHGAIPGSMPVWGAYTPLRYPNWAAKFFLDALRRVGGHSNFSSYFCP
jgi:hypothetical protein